MKTRKKLHNTLWKKKIQWFFSDRKRRTTTAFVGIVILFIVFAVWQSYAAATAIDTTITTTSAVHSGTSPKMVLTSDTTGYAFYVDSDNRCVYKKSTNLDNSSPTWGSTVIVDNQTDCNRIAVWYDQWTPGDSSGTYIYILTSDRGNDDLWFNRLDTSTDTLLNGSAPNTISSTPGPNITASFGTGGNYLSITKGTDGTLHAGISDTDNGFMVRCSSSCDTSSNWVNASMPRQYDGSALNDHENDGLILMPLSSGDILGIYYLDDDGAILYAQYDSATTTWDTSWTLLDSSAPQSTTYEAAMGATVDKGTGNIYLAYASNNNTLGGGNDEIETQLFTESTRTWAAKGDVISAESRGLTNVKIAYDIDGADVYVAYTVRTTALTATTTNVYYKSSTDDMSTWSAESSALNSVSDDFYGLSLNIMSGQRIYASWYDVTNDDLTGNTVVDIIPLVVSYDQSGYRIFQNANGTDVGTTIASANTAGTLTTKGQAFRVRLLMHVGLGNLPSGGGVFKLQYAEKGAGTCASPTGTYEDVTSSTSIAFYDNATPDDGVALTSNANDPTHSGHTIVNQTYEESNTFSNSQGAINSGQDGKWDFALFDNGASGGSVYCLRVVKSTNATLDTYTVYPEFTIANSPVITQSNYRLYNNNNGTNVGSVLAAQNTGAILPDIGQQFRLRMLLSFSTNSLAINGQPFKLQFAAKGVGTCSSPTGSYSDVTTSSAIAYFNNTTPADGVALTTNANDPTSSNTIRRQTYEEINNFNNTEAAIAAGEDGMWDFSLYEANGETGETYCLRIVLSDGTTLNSYSQYPEVTTLGEALGKDASTVETDHQNTGTNIVFLTDFLGYVFYVNDSGQTVYKKTTDGGFNWGNAVVVDSQTDTFHTAVWYDRWTPGDTTGRNIHIVTMDGGALYYTRLDTNTDTLTTPVVVSTGYNEVFTSLEYHAVITKGTAGTLYIGTVGYIAECSATCTSSGNWSSINSPWSDSHDTLLISPMANDDLMGLLWEKGDNSLEYSVFTSSAGTWSIPVAIDTSENDNSPYEVAMGITVNKTTNDLYLSIIDNANTLGDDDVTTFLYSGGSWTAKTDVVTEHTGGVMDTNIAIDENTGDVYVIYSVQTSAGNSNTGNIYWKKSTDNMTTWGTEQGPINDSPTNIWGPKINSMSSDRLYVNWYDENTTNILGETMVDLTPPAPPNDTIMRHGNHFREFFERIFGF